MAKTPSKASSGKSAAGKLTAGKSTVGKPSSAKSSSKPSSGKSSPGKSTVKSPSGKSSPGSGESNAVVLLKADHRKVEKLFKAYEAAESSPEKRELATEVCTELKIHAEVEEQIFYPFVRGRLDDASLICEAEVEHASAKDLIAQLDAAAEVDVMFDARVKVLKEYIAHHVKEEEEELFPQLKGMKADLDAVGAEMEELKSELQSKTSSEEEVRLHGLPSGLPAKEEEGTSTRFSKAAAK